MKTLFVGLVLTLGAVFLPQSPQAATEQACGLPDAKPLWIDYTDGTVPFSQELFGKPGIVAATGGALLPPQLRQLGAQTVFWEMHLGQFVGTTAAPRDPAAISGAAQRLFEKAVANSGCSTPLIALNELNGAGTTTPWSTTNAQYRANVLHLLRELAGHGAHVFLLINSPPYTDNEARDWWLQAAQVADLVPEVYFHAPKIRRQGIVLGSRLLRQGYREAVANFTRLGIPASRLGIVIGFQSGPGTGGREGLQPSSAWFEVVKLQTLAAKTVAAELGIGTIWSWGWGTYSQAGADPDKRTAACVYLWARSQSLCDAPLLAGPDFDVSLTEGQITLPDGIQCQIDDRPIAQSEIRRLAAVTRDREVAFTILYERLLDGERAPVRPEQIVAAEQALVDQRFGGSRPDYLAALAQSRASVAIARGAIADALSRARLARKLVVAPVGPTRISIFYDSYPDTLVRYVSVKPGPTWLSGRTQGFALASVTPPELFDLPVDEDSTLVTAEGTFTVRPLEDPLPLGALPLELARNGIAAALRSFARAEAFDKWEMRQQTLGLSRAMCRRDDLPGIGSIRLSSYLPFLDLG